MLFGATARRCFRKAPLLVLFAACILVVVVIGFVRTFLSPWLQSSGVASAARTAQFGQDTWVEQNLFYGLTGLTFVEFGARDGVLDSNTRWFEKNRAFRGLCVEPLQLEFGRLQWNRRDCDNVHGAISSKEGEREFLVVDGRLGWNGFIDTMPEPRLAELMRMTARGEVTVRTLQMQTFTLAHLVERSVNFKRQHVDYLSIDTEGSELEIIKSFDLKALTISVIQAEINDQTDHLKAYLLEQGYTVLGMNVGSDIIFGRKDFTPSSVGHPLSPGSDVPALV